MTLTVLTDVGSVVELSLDGSDRVEPSVVDDSSLIYDSPPIGVMLTNAVSPDNGGGGYTGGYCVVGCSDPMVVKLVSTSGNPAAAAKLYLQKADGTAGGASDQAVVDASYTGPYPLGRCMPVGPTGATRLRYITWKPQPPNGKTCQRAGDLTITSSTVLVDYASAPVKAGRRYRLDACLNYSANAVGGILVAWHVTAAISAFLMMVDIFGTYPTLSYAAGGALSPDYTLFAVGPTSGHVLLHGIFHADADGTVSAQAAQSRSETAATTVYKNSWFRVTEV